MKNTFVLTGSLLLAILVATGCSRQPTVPVVEFGETVRNVLESQIHDHEAAMHPNPDAVEGSDPYRLDATVEAYRNNVGKPAEVQRPIVINTGN